MTVRKRTRRIKGKLVYDRNYTGFFCLPWEFKERSVALKTSDKQIAEKRLREYVNVLEREREGEDIPSHLWGAPKKEITALLIEYLELLESKERGEKHINGVRVHIERLIKECRWTSVDSISQRTFEAWLASNPLTLRTEKPLSAKTKKEYQSDLQAFSSWLTTSRILKEDPLKYLKPIKTKGKETKKRRVWTFEEVSQFLATRPGGKVDYRSAVLLLFKTSLRKSSLQNLLWADVHIDTDSPYIEIRAENNKNGERLVRHIDLETKEIFEAMRPVDWKPENKVLPYKIPNTTRLQKDLKALDIPYWTEIGQIDFHAFRHTTATLFSQIGAPTAFVQMLLGHKTRAMADRYTVKNGLDFSGELSKLEPVFKDRKWTGIWTDSPDFSGHSEAQADTREGPFENSQVVAAGTSRHKKAPSVSKGLNAKMVVGAGFEPANSYENRFTVCVLWPLAYPTGWRKSEDCRAGEKLAKSFF